MASTTLNITCSDGRRAVYRLDRDFWRRRCDITPQNAVADPAGCFGENRAAFIRLVLRERSDIDDWRAGLIKNGTSPTPAIGSCSFFNEQPLDDRPAAQIEKS